MSSSTHPQGTFELPHCEGTTPHPEGVAAHTTSLPLASSLDPSEPELRTVLAERDAALLERDEIRAAFDHARSELNVRDCALNAASTHFMILDMKQRGAPIVYANRALAVAHGYEPAELLGQSAMLMLSVEHCRPQIEQINEALRAGTSIRTDLRSVRKDGSSFQAGIFLGPVHNEAGELTHYIAIGADITVRIEEENNRRQLQESLVNGMRERERMASELRLAHKLEAVGQLAAGIAHEINTPVQYVGDSVYFLQTATRDVLDLLETYRREMEAIPPGGALAAARERLREAETRADLGFLTDEMPKAIERALDGIGRVTHIVRAIKEFAHPDSQEQSAKDINHAIETTLTVARNEYKYCAAVVTQFGELPEVVCNVGELNQVFVNLIVNAAHAIHDAGKDISTGLITIRTDTDGDSVLVRIADNGCGIPERDLERIFDPFFTTKEVGKGTGQGLSIARSIVVERHGGTLDVTTHVGEGSEFTIRVPIAGRAGTPTL